MDHLIQRGVAFHRITTPDELTSIEEKKNNHENSQQNDLVKTEKLDGSDDEQIKSNQTLDIKKYENPHKKVNYILLETPGDRQCNSSR